MFKNLSQTYAGGCFLLVRKKEDSVLFLGTCFIIHQEGYLLTAAHLIEGDTQDLMIAVPQDPENFTPLNQESVYAMAVELDSMDTIHNAALLKIKSEVPIETPDHLAGRAEQIHLGGSVLSFGFPFAHEDLHNIAVQSGIISSKILSRNGTKLILFDSVIHDGMSGGPLIDSTDGRIIGITIGRFSAIDEGGDFTKGNIHPDFDTNFSYAISIEYGKKLLLDKGLDIS